MKNNDLFSIKVVVASGIGAALFLVISLISIPSFIPNITIQISYAFLALIAVVFGPVAGFLAGFLGHALKDFLTYGAWWSWIIASGAMGLITGFAVNKLGLEDGKFDSVNMIKFNVYQVIANFISWILIAPTLDILLYKEPMNKVYAQGMFAFISNAITTGVLGTILLVAYANIRKRESNLKEEQ